MKAPLIHVASMVFNTPLAIIPGKLEAILQAVGPRLILDTADMPQIAQVGSLGFDVNLAPAPGDILVLDNGNGGNGGNRQDEKPYRLTPEGIAVIPIRGTLMKRFGYLSAISGFSSYAGLRQAATAALADPQVKGVLFDVDSPGGTTHGCFELSDAIYQMRGDKPMWACANDLAASAAYALASATDRVLVTRTAGVGSIGVFALHTDQSGLDEQAGVKYTYIYAGEKKTDGNPHEPLGRSARADIQAEVDRENDIFLATVARNRGFAGATVTKVAATKAGVFFAENALPSLLADEVGTFDEALEALTAKVSGTKTIPSGKVALQTESGNNARELNGAENGEKPKEGEAAMPKPGTEDLKRAKKSEAEDAAATEAAAAKQDDEDEDDEPDREEEEKPSEREDAKKSKKADDSKCGTVTEMPTTANAPAKRIAELCQIGGVPELAAEYIVKGYSVDKVIEKLSARRAKASSEGSFNAFVSGDPGGGGARGSVDSAIEQARVMSANSGGRLSQSQCMERILRGNPDIYNGYLEERGAVAAKVAFTGGGRALTDYVLNNQRRYMANLGLGTTIEDVPGRRPM